MSSAKLILFLKVFLISTGAISIAMAIKVSVPSMAAFAFYYLPSFWTTLLTWLKPPYLYVIINGIIITIAASSLFNHHKAAESSEQAQPLITARTPPPSHVIAAALPVAEVNELEDMPVLVYEAEDRESEDEGVELEPVVVNGIIEAVENEVDEVDDDLEVDDLVTLKSTYDPPEKIIYPDTQLDFQLPAVEKPLLLSRFGPPKPTKSTPGGGRALMVARPRKQETLESTWKMITEGRHVPLTRHLKKSDAWENHGRRELDVDYDSIQEHVLKSETFRERTNYPAPVSWSPNSGEINKEPSLSKDELNRRVEAFINQFNEEMRLQRQESLNKYMEMINRGAY